MCWWDFSSYLLYRKKASRFIVKGVLELGLPSSSLPLSGFLTFPVSLSFFLSLLQALPPPLFFSFPQTENDVCCIWGIDCVLSVRLTRRQLHVVPR